MPRNRKKKGKKGGKKAMNKAAAPAPANLPPEDASRDASRRVDTSTADATLPGEREGSENDMTSRERRARRLIAKSTTCSPSSNQLLTESVPLGRLSDEFRLNVIGQDGVSVVKGNASILRCRRAKDAYSIVKQNDQEWYLQIALAARLLETRKWIECERQVTDVFTAVDRAFSHLMVSNDGSEKLVFVFDYHVLAFCCRSAARFALGKDQGAIADANEGLALIQVLSGNGMSSRDVRTHQRKFMQLRGKCLSRLCKYERAEADFRAACAVHRLREDLGEVGAENCLLHQRCIQNLLRVLTIQKVQSNASRPHYTTRQADKIEKELGIGIFSKEEYRCIGCGAEPSDGVKLLCCGGCEKVWLCGKECQKKTWEDGHKQICTVLDCGGLRLDMGNDEKRRLEEDIDKDGFASSVNNGRIYVICRDQETGKLFNSLTNEDVILVSNGDAVN